MVIIFTNTEDIKLKGIQNRSIFKSVVLDRDQRFISSGTIKIVKERVERETILHTSKFSYRCISDDFR